jgi:beta-glucosidase
MIRAVLVTPSGLRSWVVLASLLRFVVGCGDDSSGPPDAADAGMDEADAMPGSGSGYCARDAAAIEVRIAELLGGLDVEEKVGLMHGAAITLTDGVWLVEGNERLGIPGLRMLDGPRGVSAATGLNATAFPVAMMRGATWDPRLEEEVGRAIAGELLSVGGNVLLAPTMNILRHPRWGRAQETYSEDVHHMGEMAVAFIRGVQGGGVLASAKHFAANTIEDTRFEVDVQMDERTLREIYLPHFRRAVTEAHVASVMSAYNSINGFYADQQVHLLSDILKQEWGFEGFVESDWVLGTHGDVASLVAGLDIEMPVGTHFSALPGAVARGEVAEERIDAAVRRILRAQLCFGLDERPIVRDDPTMRETSESLALAREVARRGMVLLRNQSGTLPLAAGLSSIVVAGRNADVENIGDTGSSAVTPSEVVTALEGLTERAGKSATVTHVPGTALDPDQETIVQAADVVVVVTGLQSSDEGEGLVGAGDRVDLALPADEVALIHSLAALNPALVVVLEGGSAFVTSDWDADAAALLHAFYPGSEGGRALADVLFGDAAPSGRLPFSMPEAELDLPVFDNVSSTVTYEYLHGYRHLLQEETPARYPFGFGLSYTSFAYSDLTLDKDLVTGDQTAIAHLTVTNTGAVSATETVQLYVTALGSRVERSPADLRGFAQVSLEPGESGEVEIPVRAADLAFYDVDNLAWEIEPISYQVRVAANAADPGLVAELRVEVDP